MINYMPMKRILLLTFLFSLFIFHCSSQTFWIQRAGGATIDAGIAISTDTNGYSYSTGYFSTSATFGNTTLTATGPTDIYITKLNHAGLFDWAVRAGGGGPDRPTAIKADPQGNSYITGYFYATATFGTFTLTSEGLQDIFIAKYDSSGHCLWAKSCGGFGATVTRTEDFPQAFLAAEASGLPALIHVKYDADGVAPALTLSGARAQARA